MKLPRCINMKVALADYIPASSVHHKSLLKVPNRITSTKAHIPKAEPQKKHLDVAHHEIDRTHQQLVT
jgi:hypothetical protein